MCVNIEYCFKCLRARTPVLPRLILSASTISKNNETFSILFCRLKNFLYFCSELMHLINKAGAAYESKKY